MRELKIGILQQHNVASHKVNMTRLAEGIVDLARRGAQLIVLQELHNSLQRHRMPFCAKPKSSWPYDDCNKKTFS